MIVMITDARRVRGEYMTRWAGSLLELQHGLHAAPFDVPLSSDNRCLLGLESDPRLQTVTGWCNGGVRSFEKGKAW